MDCTRILGLHEDCMRIAWISFVFCCCLICWSRSHVVYHMCLWSRSSKGASYAYCSTVCTHKRLFLIPFSSCYFWPFLGIFTDPCTILQSLHNWRTTTARSPSWFYILRPFVLSDCNWILWLHKDCNMIVDCDLSGAILFLVLLSLR